MVKFVVVVLVVAFVLWLMFGRRRGGADRGRAGAGRVEGMVRCAHCGVHLPRSEALLRDGATYCSEAHRELGAPR